MSAYIAIKEIVTLTLHTRTEHKINYIELQCSAAKIYTIKLPCFQCVNVLVHTTEHQMKIYLSIHHLWNDLSRCRATYLLTPVLTGVPSFSDLHHNRTSSWSRTMAAHIFHQLPITLSSQINGQCETVRHKLDHIVYIPKHISNTLNQTGIQALY